MSWHPYIDGLLVTGGIEEDNTIRLWNFKEEPGRIYHTFKCNNPITSLHWRKSKLDIKKEVIYEDLN
jgi:WD40 repeat protein